ncbi:MAG: diacylglycerol kinase, partial [Marmoricola sp.]|nr:diacylglycerol kinase [Marmoricola sp.]
CVTDGIESLVVIGGDGMVHLAVQALAGTATRLGLVPAGTGNDVARNLDLPLKDPAAATDVVIGGKERVIDLARIGHRYYVTVLAAGFDAIVNERANQMTWPKGQMRYNLATLAELRTFSPIPYVLDVDGEQYRFDAMMVAVGNGPSFGGGMRITEGALLDDGLLDVVSIDPMSKIELIRTFPLLRSGGHVGHPKVHHYTGRRITVAAPGIVAYADGERIAALPLTVEVVPRTLRVLVP